MSESTATAAINPYKAPEAPLAEAEEGVVEGSFYVVSPTKFLIMMVGTVGMYTLYWFYKNWSLLNRKHKMYWPVMRALFAIFFTHALFNEVDGVLRSQGKHLTFSWSAGTLATVFVISSIASSVLDRLSGRDIGSPVTDIVGLLMLAPMSYCLYRAQFAINQAEDDPFGERNRAITPANIAWLVLGGVLWLVILLGMYLMLTERTTD